MTYPKSQSKLVEELKTEASVPASQGGFSLPCYTLHASSGLPPKAVSF